jgi:hypothetical protein
MIEKFPIPFKIDDTLYHSCDVDAPNAGVLADTRKAADVGDRFNSTLVFLTGCVKSIISDDTVITDRQAIKSALRRVSYRSAEVIALKAILQVHDDDGIEGVYPCPRCGYHVISQIVEENGEVISDTRDFIGNLDIEYMTDYVDGFGIVLSEPVYLINMKTNEPMLDLKTQQQVSMSSMKLRHPTLGDCIEAQAKQGTSDEMRLQFRIYVEAMIEIDGQPADKQFKEKYGMMLFERIKDVNDLGKISKEVHKYGIARRVDKHCPQCGKDWKAGVNTSNFFESAPTLM